MEHRLNYDIERLVRRVEAIRDEGFLIPNTSTEVESIDSSWGDPAPYGRTAIALHRREIYLYDLVLRSGIGVIRQQPSGEKLSLRYRQATKSIRKLSERMGDNLITVKTKNPLFLKGQSSLSRRMIISGIDIQRATILIRDVRLTFDDDSPTNLEIIYKFLLDRGNYYNDNFIRSVTVPIYELLGELDSLVKDLKDTPLYGFEVAQTIKILKKEILSDSRIKEQLVQKYIPDWKPELMSKALTMLASIDLFNMPIGIEHPDFVDSLFPVFKRLVNSCLLEDETRGFYANSRLEFTVDTLGPHLMGVEAMVEEIDNEVQPRLVLRTLQGPFIVHYDSSLDSSPGDTRTSQPQDEPSDQVERLVQTFGRGIRGPTVAGQPYRYVDGISVGDGSNDG